MPSDQVMVFMKAYQVIVSICKDIYSYQVMASVAIIITTILLRHFIFVLNKHFASFRMENYFVFV